MKKKYCAIINWSLTPYCNFNCVYCIAKYSTFPLLNRLQSTLPGRYITGSYWKLKQRITKSKDPGSNINIPKIMTTLEQFGQPVKVRLLGGEPFLVPYFMELAEALAGKHYLDIETNLSTGTVRKFCDRIDPSKVEKIRAAFHIEELEKRNLVKRYIDNLLYCKAKGFEVECFAVAYPPVIDKYFKYLKIFFSYGIHNMYAQHFIGHYKGASYPEAYTQEEIQKLGLEPSTFHNFENTKGRRCSAGKSFFTVSTIWPGPGDIQACYQIRKKLGTITEGFTILKNLILCPYEKCYCDPKVFDANLFEDTIALHTDSPGPAEKARGGPDK